MMVLFVLYFFPRDVLNKILDLSQFLNVFLPTLQYRVANLCKHPLLKFSSNQFETLHRCFQPNEDVPETFSRRNNIYFYKITAFLTFCSKTSVG